MHLFSHVETKFVLPHPAIVGAEGCYILVYGVTEGEGGESYTLPLPNQQKLAVTGKACFYESFMCGTITLLLIVLCHDTTIVLGHAV